MNHTSQGRHVLCVNKFCFHFPLYISFQEASYHIPAMLCRQKVMLIKKKFCQTSNKVKLTKKTQKYECLNKTMKYFTVIEIFV